MPFCEKMANNKGTILFKDKQIRIILALSDHTKEWHLTTLAQAASATYVHTSKFVTRCESLGIISVQRHGKIKSLFLTEKGNEIAKNISSIIEKISIPKVEDK